MNIVSLLGSPSSRSRSTALVQYAQSLLAPHADQVTTLALRDLPGEAVLQARFHDPAIVAATAQVRQARVVLVATPIYKAAYSGLLKSFLDLLPQDGLQGKTVLPLATGGSPAHLLALDYALKPVLSALGARDVLDGVFASDAQIPDVPGHGYVLDDAVRERLERVVGGLIQRLAPAPAPQLWAGQPLRWAV